jgi:hypothetical protein
MLRPLKPRTLPTAGLRDFECKFGLSEMEIFRILSISANFAIHGSQIGRIADENFPQPFRILNE